MQARNSVIAENVPPQSLAPARGRQVNKEGSAPRLRALKLAPTLDPQTAATVTTISRQ
jgi:hypothetical protein